MVFKKGDIPYNKGKHHTIKTKTKISLACKGKKQSPEHVKNRIMSRINSERPWNSKITCDKISKSKMGTISPNKGKTWVEQFGLRRANELKMKMSILHKGKKYSDERKKRMSIISTNRRHTDKTKLKLSKQRKGNLNPMYGMSGKLSPTWRGGKSFEPYPTTWNEDLKESIRKRDNWLCQECFISQDENNRQLSVHHIDYNKNNLNPNNLITLCQSCHATTNYNRETWKRHFNNKMMEMVKNV